MSPAWRAEPALLQRQRRRVVAPVAAFAAFAASSAVITSLTPAAAGPFDLFGVGPAGVAEVGARAARADDGAAAFYNPGGLGLGRGYRVEIAPQLGLSALSAQKHTHPLDDPLGAALVLDATIPLKGPLADRLRFGFAGSFIPGGVIHLIARAPDEPVFPYYENRTQRLVIMPALAAKITDRLAIGAAVNVLGGVSGAADVRNGASGAPEPRINVDATTRIAANVGLRVDPAPNVRIGIVYRQRFSVPAVIATTADVAGVPLDVGVDVREALFDPHTFVVASSVDVGRASFEFDASYAAWSSYEGPFVAVRIKLPGVLVASKPSPPLYRDVISARAAATYRIDLTDSTEVTLRGGAGFEPSMLTSAQQGFTNVVDGHKVLIGLGASILLRDLFPKPIRVGLGTNAHFVTTFKQDKVPCAGQPCPDTAVVGPDASAPGKSITNPGYPTLTAGGVFGSLSLGVGVDL